jgi:hypothetical protein
VVSITFHSHVIREYPCLVTIELNVQVDARSFRVMFDGQKTIVSLGVGPTTTTRSLLDVCQRRQLIGGAVHLKRRKRDPVL